jgi:hypothetical protein
MLTRRFALTSGAAGLAVVAGSSWWAAAGHAAKTFQVALGDEQWRERLTPDQYAVLRQSSGVRAYAFTFG